MFLDIMNDISNLVDDSDITIKITSHEVELWVDRSKRFYFECGASDYIHIRISNFKVRFGNIAVINKSKKQTDLSFGADCHSLRLNGFVNGGVEISLLHQI